MNIEQIRQLTSHLKFNIFGRKLYLAVEEDQSHNDPEKGRRPYMQIYYHDNCRKTNLIQEWKGAKLYLSPHMSEDEIIKRAYKAFRDAVEHEVMEGFTFDNIVVFNPHVNFRKLIEISGFEVKREDHRNFDI